MNEQKVDDFLAHYGVKGMKWGVRRTRRMQKVIDRHDRIAKGTASKKDRVLGANRGIYTKKGAEKALQRGARNQAKIKAGKGKALNAIALSGGIRMKDINYHGRTGVSKNPAIKKSMDRGDKATKALMVAGVAYVAVGTLAAKKM